MQPTLGFDFSTPHLSTLTPDTPCELDILGHDGDTLRMDGAQICIFKKTDKVGLGSLLQRQNGVTLETQIRLQLTIAQQIR